MVIICNKETKGLSWSGKLKIKHTRIQTIIFIVIIALLSAFYLHFAWIRYQSIASSEAIMLAQSLESLMHTKHIAALSGTEDDLKTPEYIMTKRSLSELVKTANPIRFAYLMGERNGRIIFLVDSEPPDSPDYSPPGQIYEEATDVLWSVFKTGKTLLSDPEADRWGRWISALVPIKDPATGKVIAAFGIDYSASEWYSRLLMHMIPDLVIVITVLMLFFVLLSFRAQNFMLKELSKKLAFDEALYHSVFNQAPIGIAIVNDKSFVSESEYGEMNINPMFEQILGRKSDELSNIKWTEITHPEDLKADIDNFEQFKNGEIDGYSMEKRFLKPDGSSVWTYMKVSPLLGNRDKNSTHLCLLEDISMQKAAEDLLKESERSKSVLLSHLPGLAYRCRYDREMTMLYVSDGCLKLTGYASQSLLNNREISFNDLISSEYRKLLWNEWERILPKRLPFKYEYKITTADGKQKWVLELGEGIFNEQGEVVALEGIIIDISERKEIENMLRYNYEHERWTGLFNRYYLENLLNDETRQLTWDKKALVGINLSTAQSLTIAYGFNYTQELIKKTADALSAYCTNKRLLFYTYENRFVFYFRDYKDKNELLKFTDTIVNVLESLFSLERIVGGIGIVEIDQNNKLDADRLLKNLLIASEKAINIYESDFGACFYDAEMEKDIIREQEIKRELTQVAADKNSSGLFLQYQPILDLKSNRICSFEALARLNSTDLGLISPLEFIPIAEKTKLIIPIGKKIFLQAFRFMNKLKRNGYTNIKVSVNVSAIQILANDFTDDLLDMVHEMQVCPEKIGIEITESAFFSDYQAMNNILGELQGVGLHIAIDDLGTGYSSLARERELNVNCLKIDKYFIDKLMEVHPENAITADIISIAHKMGHYVIAEGVEHEKQKEYLLNNGCEKIQGYLVSRPLDEDAAIEMLKNE
jgi:PAS domain S-box-containing protein